jgi:hypothetical protein
MELDRSARAIHNWGWRLLKRAGRSYAIHPARPIVGRRSTA